MTLEMKKAWRYYIRFYRGSTLSLSAGILASLGQSIILLAIPLVFRYCFDFIIPSGKYDRLVLAGLAILVLYLLDGGVTLLVRAVILKTTKLAVQRFRDEILKKLFTLSRTYYTEADRSLLHTKAVQDTERLDVMSNALAAQLIPSLVVSAVLCGLLVYLNGFLFLVMAAVMPLLYVLSRWMGSRVKKEVHAFHRSFERFSQGILFVLQTMDLTRLQSAEDFEIKRQREKLESLRLTSGKMAFLNTAYRLVQDTVVAAAGVIILIVGGIAVARGYMSLGDLLSFFVAVALLRNHLRTISSCLPQILEGNESLRTLYELLGVKDREPYSGTRKIALQGKIALDSVYFQYKDRPVLQDIRLTIEPGARVALVGPNGAGKSTIINLILGFYSPQRGGLFADDHPYGEIDIVHLRRSIGVVTQDPIVFPGTIHENITYGFPEAEQRQVVEAARLAAADEFIAGLQQGYETPVGENGLLLSGGEHQRIAIARAILRRPRFLILDEPTNHLDGAAVERLIGNLRELESRPSILMVSHDVNVVRLAQWVHVMKEGRIVMSGEPSQVLAGNAGPGLWDFLTRKEAIEDGNR